MTEDPKLGGYLFTDQGWKGELENVATVQDIQKFIDLYREK